MGVITSRTNEEDLRYRRDESLLDLLRRDDQVRCAATEHRDVVSRQRMLKPVLDGDFAGYNSYD